MSNGWQRRSTPVRWFHDLWNNNEMHVHAVRREIFSGQSEFQKVEVLELENYGRCLVLDEEFQSSERDEFIYHEALVQPAMVLHPNPRRVAIIGGGEGATLREVLRHRSVKRATMIELDRMVVECARKYLPTYHEGAYDDPRTELIFEDGRKYMENSREKFDVIIVDITNPSEGGPSFMLFTLEFYTILRKVLKSEGVLAVQSGTTSINATESFTTIVNTLRQVFPGVFPYCAYVQSYAMEWGFSMGVMTGWSPYELSRDEVDRRISERVTKELRYYDGLTHQRLFSIPKHLRQAIAAQTRVNRDATAIQEKYPGIF